MTLSPDASLTSMTYEVSDGIAVATLATPDNYNALTRAMGDDLVSVLEAANSDPEVRVLVITGEGNAFSAGGETKKDLPSFVDKPTFLSDRSPAASGPRSFVFHLQGFEKPVIAALNGVAAGGGLSLALACDIRIASDRARLANVFTRRGLIPDTGATYLLPRMVGLAKAYELTFTGAILDAQSSLELGLVNQVVPHDELMDETLEMAHRIAAGPPIAIKLAKRALRLGAEASLEVAYELEANLQATCLKTDDFLEGIAAFNEKRPPKFEGR